VRLRGVFFSGERRACWRRREGVGEHPGPPAVEGEVRGVVGEGEEVPGTVAELGGGADRWRWSADSGGAERQIAAG
jgi:hypothetical protein